MSPRQKAIGSLVFFTVFAAIMAMLFFVGEPVVTKLRKPEPMMEPVNSYSISNGHSISQVDSSIGLGVIEYRDNEHHVTCWTHGSGISCLRDQP